MGMRYGKEVCDKSRPASRSFALCLRVMGADPPPPQWVLPPLEIHVVNRASLQVDWWALGIVLYEFVYGESTWSDVCPGQCGGC